MAPKLYINKVSPGVRAVLMCAHVINLELELIEVDLSKKDQLKPEFIKINPLHTVPTLDDNGIILYDSHVIMGYLIGKYAKGNSLYPAEVEKKALIDLRLFFDASVLFIRHCCVVRSFLSTQKIPDDESAALQEAFGYLETFLQSSKYVAGNTLSIADFSIVTSLTNASVLVPLDEAKYPKISAWRKNLEALPCYEMNREGRKIFIQNYCPHLSK